MPNFYKISNKRKLQDRSHLAIEFPIDGGKILRTYIPMLENCSISESGRANLAEYNPIGRAGTLFAYTGAKSREISLTFKISFLHLLELEEKEGLSEQFYRQFKAFFTNKDEMKKAFFQKASSLLGAGPTFGSNIGNAISTIGNANANIQSGESVAVSNGVPHASIHRTYYQKLIGLATGDPGFFTQAVDAFLDLIKEPRNDPNGSYAHINKLIDLVIFWINLIRATTHNKSTNTVFGPPIVRLTHGPLFNNVPFVVDSYSISPVEEAGYEVQTFLPKQIEISLSMMEVRTNNFDSFQINKLEGDTITGWESVLSDNNMDPYNGLIRPISN